MKKQILGIITMMMISLCLSTSCTTHAQLSKTESGLVIQTAVNFINALRVADTKTMTLLLDKDTFYPKVLQRKLAGTYVYRWRQLLYLKDRASSVSSSDFRLSTQCPKTILDGLVRLSFGDVKITTKDIAIVEYKYFNGRLPALILMHRVKNKWFVASMPESTTAIYKYKTMDDVISHVNDDEVATGYKFHFSTTDETGSVDSKQMKPYEPDRNKWLQEIRKRKEIKPK